MQNQTTTQTAKRNRRALAGLATLATAAALVAPAASPAVDSAHAAGCSPFVCGSDGNHNEVMASTLR